MNWKDTTGEYFVMITSESVSLPSFCPVCHQPATSTAIIGSISAEEREKAERLRDINRAPVGGFHRKPTLWAKPGSVKRLAVPVCDEHIYSIDEYARTRGIAAITGGVSLIALVLSAVSFSLSIARGLNIDLLWLLLPIISFIVSVISYRVLGPSSVEKAVTIEEFSPGGSYMVLKISDKNYRDEVIRLNPMKAKAVRKIQRNRE